MKDNKRLKVLFAWLGNADIQSIKRESNEEAGPIAMAVAQGEYERLVLLSSYPKKDTEGYVSGFSARFVCEIELYPVRLSSPTEYSEIYEAVTSAIEATKKKIRVDGFSLAYHLSPGTPAMSSIWMLVAHSVHPAELIETSHESGLKQVKLPFDISADYIPASKESFERELMGLAAGGAPESPELESIVCRCKEMKDLVKQALHLSRFDIPVLLLGESGTGKELFARAMHKSSDRREGLFVAVNCGAIPSELVESELFGYAKGAFTGAASDKKGYLEEAHCGTLFLDEIGELSPKAQVKLLRAIQEKAVIPVGATKEKAVDFRVIAATNRDLFKDVTRQRFREDLFHRIAVGVLELPPVRERQGDLSLLIEHFLDSINKTFAKYQGWVDKKLSAGAKNLMLSHDWPGNVRELQNTLTRMMINETGDSISRETAEKAILDFKDDKKDVIGLSLGNGFDIQELVADVSRHYLKRAMEQSGGKKTRAAELLGLPNYQTFSNWCERYGVE